MTGDVRPGAPSGQRVLLALEASTAHASVAVLRAGRVVAEGGAVMRPGADDALLPAVAAALEAAGARPRDVAAVVCGGGPGGFTSLRIAAAAAKGLARATGARLAAVPSLALAAAARAASAAPGPQRWLVSLDALRGERYVAEVDTVHLNGRAWVTACRDLGVRSAGVVAAEVAHAVGRRHVDANVAPAAARAVAAFDLRPLDPASSTPPDGVVAATAVDPAHWAPAYGRLAEAQVRWEQQHGRGLEIGRGDRAPAAG